MKDFRFGEEAQADFDAALAYYREIRPKLGEEFYAGITAAIDVIRRFPDAGSPEGYGVRSLVVKRFPYLIYYETMRDYILIWAVMHGSRDRSIWKSRLP